jgi:hypothetical protein
MSELLHAAAGASLTLTGWLIPRHVSAARAERPVTVLIDLLPVLFGAGLLLIATGRPIFVGFFVLSLGAGFALADRSKREALREPVVFSDMSELRHVFTHPQLYLPFAGPSLVIGGTLATLALGIALLWLEPPLWRPDALLIVLLFAAVCAIGSAISQEPALGTAAAVLRHLDPIGEPVEDTAALGPFSALLVYGVIARAERATRQALHAPMRGPSVVGAAAAVPLVLVQCESFFGARRVSPSVPKDLLPGFDACLQRGGATFGRLEVAGWGANTMRAEFAVLTGIRDWDLGYDRFNPYHAFARAPIASLAWRLRREGYRTLCLHPFDRSFFRRDLTLRALGFETFLGRETLGGSNRPPYFSDPDLAQEVLRVLDDSGPRTFIFVITMGNHGPWLETGLPIDPDLRRRFDPAGVPQGGQFLRYLDGLVRSDEMLQILAEGLGPRQRDGVFGFYGDHLPSLPLAFDRLGFNEWASDYVVMDGAPASVRQLDLPAHHLPRVILDRLRERNAVAGRLELALGAA